MSYKTYEVRVYANGNKGWYLNDKLHREDGPAVEYTGGDKLWYLNGKLHREDGPAFEGMHGDKIWYQNDKRHREDGPAVEYADGEKVWYQNGNKMTQEEFNLKTKSCSGKIVEIDGKKYRLSEVL